MKKPDHDMYREWLDAEAFGDLSPEGLARLDRHAAECPECEEERRDFAHLATVLSRGQLPVRADFRQSVMEALPAAGWEARSPRTWSFPAAVALVLGILAAVCFGAATGAPGSPAGSPVLGAVSALAGFFRATLVAGLGLVHAGWKGWGMVFGELFASWSALAAFAVLVISLNLLLLSLVRRRPAREIAARGDGPRL